MRHELVKEFVTVSSQGSTPINNNHSKPYQNIQKAAQPTTQRSVPKTRKIRVQEATTSRNEETPKVRFVLKLWGLRSENLLSTHFVE